MAPLATFPFLTPAEFESACRALVDRACRSVQRAEVWSPRLVTQNGTSLRITRYIDVQIDNQIDPIQDLNQTQAQDDQVEDDDPEALVRIDVRPCLQIDYDIVLSSTYQVPILYFALRWNDQQGPLGLDAVYQYVVPEQYQKELRNVGVMGGISMGYHPVSGTPAFFVHPCNTADAMAQVADAQSITLDTYLLIWLGLVGHCVNLHIPRELVVSDHTGLS